MTKPSNQAIEMYYFDNFRQHYLLPPGEVVHMDKPDVLIRGPITIGVEIANLYKLLGSDSNSEQRQRPLRKKLLNLAQQIHRENDGNQIELIVEFNPERAICKSKIESVAKEIANLAQDVQNNPSGPLRHDLFDHIPELRSVYCYSKEHPDAMWRSQQCVDVPQLSVELVRRVVASKSHKREKYEPCDVYWLLLVVDLMDSAQDQELNWPIDEPPLGSPCAFDRVLVYKPQFGAVLEVPLRASID